ncbi:putative hemolysin [Yersinia rohdei]|nr:putative hemolysin [Yersinia rohdei]
MAQVNGNSALAGVSGAVMGEYIAQKMYPGINREDLTEEQRQTISALGTLAAGLAGGLAGGSTADAVAGAQAGKNTQENNSLGLGAGDIGFWLGNTPDCDTTCKAGIAKGIAEGNLVVSAGVGAVAGGAMIVAATPDKAALKGCKAEPAICLNNVGLLKPQRLAELVLPELDHFDVGAPYLAHEISKYLPADQSLGANLMAHAVLGAVVGHFSGNATVGATSAFTAEAAAPAIIKAMGWDKDSLTEKQKQTVSALATLAAGLAGGLVGDSSSSAVAGAQAGKNAVENNALSAPQIDDFAARAKGCEARGDCGQIVKEMEELSLKQRNELIVTCASDAAACKEKYGDIPDNSMLVHEAIDRALGEDIPWAMKNDLSVLLMQQMDESGIVNSTEFAQRLQTLYGLDSQKAEILAGAAMAAVTGGLGKADNRLPIPAATVARNGFKIESNHKHTPGSPGSRPSVGVEPKNSLVLFENSIATKDPKIRLSIDSDGNIHRFFNTSKDGSGTYHWSGSTGDGKNALGNKELGIFNKEIRELKAKK